MPVAESIEPNRMMLLTWFAIEGLIFTGNLISHVIFMHTMIHKHKGGRSGVRGLT